MAKYEIKLIPSFTAPRRRRAGIEVPRGMSIIVDVTAEQVEQLKADNQLIVKKKGKDLSELKRGELDDIATEAGLDPKDYSNKAEIIEAITAQESEE